MPIGTQFALELTLVDYSLAEFWRHRENIVAKNCKHQKAQFHSTQQLGKQAPIELWHCPVCNSTFAKKSEHKCKPKKNNFA